MAYPSLPAKKTTETLDYQFNWAPRLAGMNNDVIIQSSFMLTGNSTATISANSFTNVTSTVWVSNGLANTTATIINTIVTAGGRTIETGAKLKIEAI